MFGITDLKTGTTFVFRGEPYQVVSHEHSKMGRGGAVLRVRMRNLQTGAVIDENFKGNDTFEEANLEKRKAQYLYAQGDQSVFMDQVTYDQFELSDAVVGDQRNYLVEGSEVDVLLFDNQPIGLSLPIKVRVPVAETPPGFKGDTAARSYKPATLVTGAVVQVPFHIKAGDAVIIDTRSGDYVERAEAC